MATLFNPFYVAIDGNGTPMAGALLYFYLTGSSTPQNTYTSVGLGTANTNPVVADANGLFPPIYFPSGSDSGTAQYKAVLETSAHVVVDTLDPVTVLTAATATAGGLVPTPPNDATKFLNGQAAFVVPPSATATTAGYVPTPPNDAAKYLNGQAAFVVPVLSKVVNVLAADVNLNNTGTFFDGPSTAQGSTGIWYASGTVTLSDSAGTADYSLKLWDGTSTQVASGFIATIGAGVPGMASLSGVITNPVGNIRISVKDVSSTSGKINSNLSGMTAPTDSVLTVIRIG